MANKFNYLLLDQKTPAVGAQGTPVFQMQPMAPDQLVMFLVFQLLATFTVSGSPSLTPYEFSRYISSVDIKSDALFVHSTGLGLFVNHWKRSGKAFMNFVRTAGSTWSTYVVIGLADRRSKAPLAGAIPGNWLKNESFNVGTSSTTAWGTSTTLTAMTIRLWAAVTDGIPGFVPAHTRIEYQDWTQQTANLPPGLYQDAMIYKETAPASGYPATISSGGAGTPDIATLQLTMDGAPILMNTFGEWAAAVFNLENTPGGSTFAGNPAGVVGAGSFEQIDDNAQPFVNVYSPPHDYGLDQLQGSLGTPNAQLTGALTTPRWHYQYFGDATQIQSSPAVIERVQAAHPNHNVGSKLTKPTNSSNPEKQQLLNATAPGLLT